MNQEAQFKSVLFGGFQKEDVLAYIQSLQTELIAASQAYTAQEQFAKSLLREKAELEEDIATERTRNKEGRRINDDYARRILALSQEKDELEIKYKNLEEDCEKLRDVEGQVSNLIMDALLYSEKIIQRAKEASGYVKQDAKQTIRSSAQEVDDIGDDISRFSVDFSDTLNNLAHKINTLSLDLSSVADKLALPDEDSEQFEFNEDGYPVLRAVRQKIEEEELPRNRDADTLISPQMQDFYTIPLEQEAEDTPSTDLAEAGAQDKMDLEDALSFLSGELEQTS